MRVWFDLANSPHVTLFAPLIADLKEGGDEVVISCRPLANTIDLIALEGLDATVVGKHYGAGRLQKVAGFPVRAAQLARFARHTAPDVGVSQASFAAPPGARLAGVPSVYLNDNEHATGNVPAFVAADRILVPEYMPIETVRKMGARRSKITRYPGVKEGIYLWRIVGAQTFRAPRDRPHVYVRPEPWAAHYYHAAVGFLDALVNSARTAADVTILPRDATQATRFRNAAVDGVVVLDRPKSVAEIAADCDLFVGAGGTMTREMAVLGVPTVSVYQEKLLGVDRHLVAIGAMTHEPGLTPKGLLRHLSELGAREPVRDLLSAGREADELLRATINEVAERSR
jgi:predicted glycosyltransferase